MPSIHRLISVLVFSAIVLHAAAAEKTVALLNAGDLSGWEFVTSPAVDIGTVCKFSSNGVLAVTGKPLGYIATKAAHQNYRLHTEWRWTDKPGNSGLLVHITGGPKDRQWPMCYQVQTKHKSVGDLIPMAGVTFAEPLTTAPGANPALRAHSAPDSEKSAGEWNSCDIVCRGDMIEVTINGVPQNKVTGCSVRAGKIGFQFEGVPFELRNIQLTALE